MFGRNRIAAVEFFGYKGMDAEAVRRALPLREGDALSKDSEDQVRAAVRRLTARDATDVTLVCCVRGGDSVLFIGLPGASSRTFAYNPIPSGEINPAPELARLYREMGRAEYAAVRRGAAQEDYGSAPYRLLKDPRARATEIALREYALRHQEEIALLLKSREAATRAMAADALGYCPRTSRQLEGLVQAAADPDSEVRNNATRALVEILRADRSAAAQVPPDLFIDMVRSGHWTDRNKASMLLMELTRSRDPALLARLKREAGDALLEIARWPDSWNFAARLVLARTAGIPEERGRQLASGPLGAFLAAVER